MGQRKFFMEKKKKSQTTFWTFACICVQRRSGLIGQRINCSLVSVPLTLGLSTDNTVSPLTPPAGL